jgi:hypothetical protein
MDAETIAADPSLAAVLRDAIAALRAVSANDRNSLRSS